jgi:hypothetical protein
MGVSEALDWSPWPISYTTSGTGSSITIVDTTHPLLTTPNEINSSVDYQGHFNSIWTNFSVLATDGTNPTIIACSTGSGKLALTTTIPSGSGKDEFIENVVEWSSSPSILVKEIALSQSIIWANDQVVISIELTDLVGIPITSVNLDAWLNTSSVDVVEVGSGVYTITLNGAFTSAHIGTFDIILEASKAGFDTLSITFEDFLFIRPFPWLVIGILGGGIAIAIVGWVFLKRRRNEPISYQRKSRSKPAQKTKDEKKKQEEEDGKFDPKEFFGV